MRTISLCGACLVFGIGAATADAAVGTIINDAELRAKPKLDAKPGREVESGTRVEILGSRGAWIEVKTPEGQRGWLRLMNVRPGEKKHWSETVKAGVGSVGVVVRTASTESTATTGIRGISKEQLENATPNFDEVKLLDRFQVSAAEARKFAAASKIRPQQVGVLDEDDDQARQ
jgi:hypothetical protein